jgi:general secretion pathway protein A
MLTGPYGVGKSLTLEQVSRHAQKLRLPVIHVDAIPDGSLPMARHILRSLGINQDHQTLPELLMLLQAYCQANSNRNLTRHLLLIDEAHFLASGQGFYLAHYLSNLRIPAAGTHIETPLFTIIMAGTESLRESIKQFESLRRRIQLDWMIRPLSPQQTSEYVQHHMRAMGGDIWSFARDALDSIYHFSQGIPRSINNLCDTALMLGFAAQASQINADIIDQAAQDTGLAALVPAPTEQEPAP